MDYTPNPRKNKHLHLTEQVEIELILQKGKTAYTITKTMQRSINTILHEIKCGSFDQIKAGKRIRIYLAEAEQTRYVENRKTCQKLYQVLECEDFLHFTRIPTLPLKGAPMNAIMDFYEGFCPRESGSKVTVMRRSAGWRTG